MASLFLTGIYFCITFVLVKAYPVANQKDSVEYLTRFGYLNPNIKNTVSLHAETLKAKVREGLKNFQYFAGITPTGVLDETTVKAMNLPRCGNSELEKGGQHRRRRFVLDSKWEKIFLNYKIVNYPTAGPNRTVVDAVVQKAFGFWSDAANIHVQPTRSPVQKADIEISFVRGRHNDGIEFDVIEGVGRVVAHAWKPFNAEPLRGDMHFNDEVSWGIEGMKPWTRESNATAYDFFRTAIHEAGHALGLEHSPHPEAMMYFAVTGQHGELKLTKDDLQGIQELYGRKLGGSSTSGPSRDPLITWKADLENSDKGRRPIVVPSGIPQANVPWECYRFQEQNPKDAKGIQRCYRDFYTDVYLGQK